MVAMTNCLNSGSGNFKLGATKCCNLCKEMQQPSCQPRPLCPHLFGYFLCCRKQFTMYFFFSSLSPLLNVGHKLLHTVRFVWFGFVSFRVLQFAIRSFAAYFREMPFVAATGLSFAVVVYAFHFILIHKYMLCSVQCTCITI